MVEREADGESGGKREIAREGERGGREGGKKRGRDWERKGLREHCHAPHAHSSWYASITTARASLSNAPQLSVKHAKEAKGRYQRQGQRLFPPCEPGFTRQVAGSSFPHLFFLFL